MGRRPRRNIFYKIILFGELLYIRREIREGANNKTLSRMEQNFLWEKYYEMKEELKNII